MPNLTRLERAQDICWSTWRSPDGRSVSDDVPTPITPRQIDAWLNGADPPKPASIPATWVHKESRLERMFTNGQQAIGENEIGDISAYVAGGVKAPENYVAVIKELGDDPVTVIIGEVVKGPTGSVSTTRDTEASTPTRSGKVPTYRIVNDVAVKVSER